MDELNFVPEDGMDHDFGTSVAVFEDTLLVGAPLDGAGSVYVLERTGRSWSEAARLRPSDGDASSGFGNDVALSPSTALVGTSRGAVHVFTRDADGEWNTGQRLAAGEDNGASCSVALDRDTALVGMYRNGTPGAAYVFVREGASWELQQELVRNVEDEGTEFGRAVGLSGDTALVGAPNDANSAGAVYVFTRDGALWKQTLLLGGDEGKEKGFGHAVAIHGDVILAAAAWGSSGSVHVWERTESEWDWVQTLASPRGAEDHFGDSISLFAYTALIAAPGSGDLGESFGSAHTFKRVPEPMR